MERKQMKAIEQDANLIPGNCVVQEQYINGKLTKSKVLQYTGIANGFFCFQVEKDKDYYIKIKPECFPYMKWTSAPGVEREQKIIITN